MSTDMMIPALDFQLPSNLECAQPTEVREMTRDAVRLLVSDRSTDILQHSHFRDLPNFLQAGDVLVVNTSATLNAALPTQLTDGSEGRIHLSTRQDEDHWLIEVRQVHGQQTRRYFDLKAGQRLSLPVGGNLQLLAPYYTEGQAQEHLQLWRARIELPLPIAEYLQHHGHPIRYQQLHRQYPLAYYQTAFAAEPGSAEMPSAGRAFTPELIAQLVIKGVQFAPIVLHTGVSSLETNERPYPEYFRVPTFAASTINRAREDGRRIIAVGTTATRAIESAVGADGRVMAREGWTDLFITPERGLRVINGMLTGFHEPRASHLLMLAALADTEHLEKSYRAAINKGYLWHEFGDLHLIV